MPSGLVSVPSRAMTVRASWVRREWSDQSLAIIGASGSVPAGPRHPATVISRSASSGVLSRCRSRSTISSRSRSVDERTEAGCSDRVRSSPAPPSCWERRSTNELMTSPSLALSRWFDSGVDLTSTVATRSSSKLVLQTPQITGPFARTDGAIRILRPHPHSAGLFFLAPSASPAASCRFPP